MKNFLLTWFLVSVFFGQETFGQITRPTSFDDRPICQETKGVWRQFGNGCADDCRSKFDQFSICTQALTYGCDCGKSRCWNGDKCVSQKSYKEIFDVEMAADAKLLNEAKEKRKLAAKENEQQILSKFVVQDPNNPNPANLGSQPSQVVETPQTPITTVQPNSLGNNDLNAVVAAPNSVPDEKMKEADLPPFFQKKQKQEAQNAINQQIQSDAIKNAIFTAPAITKAPTSAAIPPGLPEIPLP